MTDLFALAASMADLQGDRPLPPVETWNPDHCGEIDITIRRDGIWVHEGSPIGRTKLVRLFSTVLKREGDDYFLVTPVEKLQLTVEDVPFLAVGMEVDGDGEGQTLRFRTNVGDEVIAGPDHPITFRRDPRERADDGALVPYVEVRAGLKARLTRTLYYDFVTLLRGDPPSLRSAGAVFPYEEIDSRKP
ncbi:DUF1285 domain-containing protein [Aquisalinus flavus]|nr:DUF1285 domain-containing protein [Aquisalinus flavus]MBD0426848.1 DUF1285 domain-containing protein [Aquisalinus flavus]UNE46695.1 DUF1285 domain-containing protein [Aquisalinus flavus]